MVTISKQNDLVERLRAMLPKPAASDRCFAAGLPALDQLLPSRGIECGTIHEFLTEQRRAPATVAAIIVRAAVRKRDVIVWCDGEPRVYTPALKRIGIPLDRLFILRVADAADQRWAINECLRCKGVGAVIAPVIHQSQVEARRLQLSAERGGGIGILLRPIRALHQPYAAATRWIVQPASGSRTVHRWTVELIHGHGGRVGQSVTLEVNRATGYVRAVEMLGDGSAQTPLVAAASA